MFRHRLDPVFASGRASLPGIKATRGLYFRVIVVVVVELVVIPVVVQRFFVNVFLLSLFLSFVILVTGIVFFIWYSS